MPRPRKKTFPLSQLHCFENVLSELHSIAELDDFDVENAILTFKQRKQPYTAKPENLENALKLIKEYISTHPTTKPGEINKREMSDILQVSRPTIDKWINAGIIQSEVFGTIRGIEIDIFTTDSILKGLEALTQK